ncbi:MAG: 2-oxo acid dehydrogenase subunit E2 [Ktedonobacteraceae bacterium]|nr:2-oxo acid dehydrogenase subunit E2 [Ktedonobacteraceae bacterium]
MPDITMPRLSDTMQEGTISRWLKKPGDEVKKGDVLAEVETDKATMDIESYDSGILEQITAQEGETVPIGQVIAVIGSGAGTAPPAPRKEAAATAATPTAPATTSQAPAAPSQAPAPQPQQARPSTPAQVETPPPPAERAGAIKASPLARRMAEEHSIDLRQLRGTGPGGRIVRDDIEDYIEQQRAAPATQAAPAGLAAQPATVTAQPSAAVAPLGAPPAREEAAEVVSLSQMQKTIARRLVEAKQTVPHFYISSEIDMTEALAMRQKLNEAAGEEGIKISVNDLIIKACALALEKFPEVNSSYQEGQFIRHKQINIGIAVDVPDGLVVPVLRDANLKGLRTIAREAKTLIEKARAGRLSLTDFQGGTFSVSNLGMMDVTDFIAVINPPEAAILAVAAVRKTFVPVNGQPVLRDIMRVTVSADHRIIYGATVARFLQEVKHLLQDVYLLLG